MESKEDSIKNYIKYSLFFTGSLIIILTILSKLKLPGLNKFIVLVFVILALNTLLNIILSVFYLKKYKSNKLVIFSLTSSILMLGLIFFIVFIFKIIIAIIYAIGN
jgi:hypothetical protein